MTVMTERVEEVRCDFDGCDSSMIFRVLLAVVDQLCADVDTNLAVLESLDIPLEECIDALHPRGVETAAVTSGSGRRLVIDLHLRRGDGLLDTAPLGDGSEIIESFFDVEVTDDPARVRLSVRFG